MSSYFDDCVDLLKRGVVSYVGVLKNLKEARGYHSSRSVGPFDDGGAPSKMPFKLWIPLFWGTF